MLHTWRYYTVVLLTLLKTIPFSLLHDWQLLRKVQCGMRSVMHVIYTLSCSIPTPFRQLDLNPANMEATVEAE